MWQIITHPLLLVGVGGGLGSIARYAVGQWLDPEPVPGRMPWGTFAVNVSGSFVLGLLALVVLERLPREYKPLYVLLGTGFCGGFTTFSTFEWETFRLLREGAWGMATLYVAGSVACGFVGVLVAAGLVRLVSPSAV